MMKPRSAILAEVHATLGSIPQFFNRIPDPHLAFLWDSMRDLQLEPGFIPMKYQQLLMFAVATYSRCKYCTDFHTQAIRAMGGTEDEILEAVRLTGHTAELSNYLGALQCDVEQFKADMAVTCKALVAKGCAHVHVRPSAVLRASRAGF